MEIESLVVLLVPDALGDNQFLDTSLSPEHIRPRDSPRPTRAILGILRNTHLRATCPLIGTELQSGTSVLEQVQSPSSKRWEIDLGLYDSL